MASAPKIALDTNIIVSKPRAIQALRTHFGANARVVVPTQVEKELQALAGQTLLMRKKWVIWQHQKKEFKISEKKVNAQNADAALLKLCTHGFLVATLDRKLQHQIRQKGKRVLRWRGTKIEED